MINIKYQIKNNDIIYAYEGWDCTGKTTQTLALYQKVGGTFISLSEERKKNAEHYKVIFERIIKIPGIKCCDRSPFIDIFLFGRDSEMLQRKEFLRNFLRNTVIVLTTRTPYSTYQLYARQKEKMGYTIDRHDRLPELEYYQNQKKLEEIVLGYKNIYGFTVLYSN